MTIDKEKLKTLAEAATKLVVDWRVMKDRNNVNIVIGDGGWTIFSAWHTPDGKALANAEFAAAANPNTVKALLDEIEVLRASLKYIRDTTDDWHVAEKAADALSDTKERP